MQRVGQVYFFAEGRCSMSNRLIDVVGRLFDHDGVGETLGIEPIGRLAGSVVTSVGQHDPLAVGPSPFVPAVNECHKQSCPERYNSEISPCRARG